MYIHHNYLEEENIEDLVAAIGLQDVLQVFKDKMNEIRIFNTTMPQEPIIDLGTTLQEQLTKKSEYELQREIFNTTKLKLEREACNALKKFKEELNKKPEIKEFIARLNKYKRNVSKFRNECSEKSQLAKINVSISSTEVKESLKDLLQFSITIW